MRSGLATGVVWLPQRHDRNADLSSTESASAVPGKRLGRDEGEHESMKSSAAIAHENAIKEHSSAGSIPVKSLRVPSEPSPG